MKILVANYKGSSVSGAEFAITDMVSEIGGSCDVTMLVPTEGNLANFYRKKGIRTVVRPISNKRRLYPGLHYYQSHSLRYWMLKEKFDLVLCNTFFAGEKMALSCQMSRIPMVVYAREYVDCARPEYARVIKSSAMILGVSLDVCAHYQSHHNNVKVAYDFFLNTKVEDCQYASNIPEKNPDSLKVALVGRITPYKRPSLFVESFWHVINDVPNIEYYLVGGAADNELWYEELVKNAARGDDRIHFLGHRTDVSELYKKFDVCCMVSKREPYPRVIIEAQAAGIPVVAANTGGAPEMVDDGVTGFMFNGTYDDPRILANALIDVLWDRERRNEVAANAKKARCESLIGKAQVAAFLELLNSVQV